MEKHFAVETLLPACKRERVDCPPVNQAATGFCSKGTQELEGIKKIL